MRNRKVVFLAVVLTTLAAGAWTAYATVVFPLPPPDDDCRWISCAPCPDGYVFSPTEEDCCACIPIAEF